MIAPPGQIMKPNGAMARNAMPSYCQYGLVRTPVHSFASAVKKCELGPTPGVPKNRHTGCDADTFVSSRVHALKCMPERLHVAPRPPPSMRLISAGSAVMKYWPSAVLW